MIKPHLCCWVTHCSDALQSAPVWALQYLLYGSLRPFTFTVKVVCHRCNLSFQLASYSSQSYNCFASTWQVLADNSASSIPITGSRNVLASHSKRKEIFIAALCTVLLVVATTWGIPIFPLWPMVTNTDQSKGLHGCGIEISFTETASWGIFIFPQQLGLRAAHQPVCGPMWMREINER